ncbi:hypothetical protein ORI89_11535 [Sphingobacterium sp. UT-1RO-CII-1]|uniref:hypothetical protein n=1 Tax=Sphingobacterium sp. UT-1RO-CII-1 TaxID=2995225 RepID=UPI00227D5702|nr:hypothetical protein [Sphingobacterium sp. UT-1RO-CII-1]MCY4780284.1 hypothetical protein [Sphingobacterium sp. UT-1RO-CII-1]
MTKKIIIASVLAWIAGIGSVLSCEVCERNQPKMLRGIVHGQGPDSQWDYLIIGAVAVIVVITIYLSVKYLVKPGEKGEQHIKRTFLDE